ncbi:MAG: hypothetical protein MI974_14995 [Chitinophagales bacterium]|nr:hypothetical protein [Chitinophagales bacterium]
MKKEFEIGWTNINYQGIYFDEDESFASFNAESDCTFFDSIYRNYRNIHTKLADENLSILYYRLSSKWYITEISDLLSHSFPFYDKIIIETPPFEVVQESWSNSFLFGWYRENPFDRFNTARCQFTFFTQESLYHLQETFKDSIADKEILILPYLNAWGNEDDGMNFYEYADYNNHISETSHYLFNQNQLEFYDNSNPIDINDEFQIFSLKCDNPFNMIKLRRDESDYFNRIKNYSKEVIESKNFSHKELVDAIETGYLEYKSRLDHLKRKGVLTRIGASLFPIGASFGLLIDGNLLSRSGILISMSSTAMLIRAVLDQIKSESDIKKEPYHFLRLANKIGKWQSLK